MLFFFSHSVVSDSLWPNESQQARPHRPSPTPGVHSNSCPLSRWCHPAISSSLVPFSSCPQSLPASGSYPMSQLFAWGGQSIGISASASFPPINTQDWSPLGWTGWIFLQSKGTTNREWVERRAAHTDPGSLDSSSALAVGNFHRDTHLLPAMEQNRGGTLTLSPTI